MCYSSSLQVDGEEDIKKGIDLMEFSQILQSVGCWQAVVSTSVVLVY